MATLIAAGVAGKVILPLVAHRSIVAFAAEAGVTLLMNAAMIMVARITRRVPVVKKRESNFFVGMLVSLITGNC